MSAPTILSHVVETYAGAVAWLVEARRTFWREHPALVPLEVALAESPDVRVGGTLYMVADGADVPLGVTEWVGFRRSPAGTRRVPWHLTDEQFEADARAALYTLPILPAADAVAP